MPDLGSTAAPASPAVAYPQSVAPSGELVGVSGITRLGSYLLESLLMGVTLGIGWLIWASMTAGAGQTPAKKLLGLRVIDLGTMKPATLGKMFWSRGFLGGLVASIAFPITIGILVFMPFWDKRNQNLFDKVSNSIVVKD